MRRPNPWVAIPSLALGLLAAVLGWVVTDLSCGGTPGGGCPGWSLLISLLSFVVVTAGVAVILVLVYRSLSEWREGTGR